MDRRPFRFAVQATAASDAQGWREFVCKVEDLGYSSLLLADHYLGPGPAQRAARTPRQDLAPIAAIAVAAAHTTVLRVGCRVFCIDYHVPAVLAKEAATLDLLSDGRFELGIGAGWSAVEYDALGLTFDAPGRRIAKLKEVVGLIKAHCGHGELDRSGEYVNVHGYKGTPPPVQRPHPPIMIGGGGRRVLSYAAQEADIVSINTVPFTARNEDRLTPQQEAARRIEYVRSAAGPRLVDLDIESSPFFVSVIDDASGVQDAYERMAAKSGIDPEVLRDHPNVLVGPVDAIVETLQERRESYGANYVTVPQRHAEQFAPVVAHLTDT
ncbi:F420-dependent oxidoreductase [Mycobacterium intermedium]|uniref:F420-dependent oxidoreductase n=1 Tax=Mycobacterium intermedium TaxID=28445 RepID=A0A1E3SDW3_MYCIE|nr:TIGR03621 family F420-dependent LLM class oxidoreductase [Mycobacterium intermedium]MCV6963918.1 TIGR03621 family F420-dependent LLM class oxidoreductase [Mycobacterium intermedium]ODR00262.1 F420-dependent oxidoreductase [Mycobacterium intermedium]OPE47545.1 F420-dependent oxidoreductase [Mycobacterium intermedium]ORA95386.1 F420-dependent oxidoreductase [Mycobacterium intermedium]